MIRLIQNRLKLIFMPKECDKKSIKSGQSPARHGGLHRTKSVHLPIIAPIRKDPDRTGEIAWRRGMAIVGEPPTSR